MSPFKDLTRGAVDRRRVSNDENTDVAADAKARLYEGAARALVELVDEFEALGAVERALGALGKAAGVQRAFVLAPKPTAKGMLIRIEHEWMDPSMPPLVHHPAFAGEHVASPSGRRVLERLAAGEPVITKIADLPQEMQTPLMGSGISCGVGVPIRVRGQYWGVLCVTDCEGERTWTTETLTVLEMAALAIGHVFARESVVTELRETSELIRMQAERIRVAHEVLANPRLSYERQLERALEETVRLLSVDFGLLARVQGRDWVVEHVHSPSGVPSQGARIPVARPLMQAQLTRRDVIELSEAEVVISSDGIRLHDALVIPVWAFERPWGVLLLGTREASHGPYADADRDFVTLIGQWAGSVIERLVSDQEKSKLEDRFREAQKFESLGTVVGGIAHDFNNLLMAVLGNASLAMVDLPPGSNARECVENVVLGARRAAELTNQMLTYAGRSHVDAEVLEVNDILVEMAQLLGTVISKKARVEYELARSLPCVAADPAQLRQVVMNLMTNASDAIGDAPGCIVLRTGVQTLTPDEPNILFVGREMRAGDYVFLEVSDTGCGMTKDTVARIFDPFFSTKFEGRGLGLAAVHGIVRGHNGAISVESEVGVGTTIRVLLPAVAARVNSRVSGATAPGTGYCAGSVLVVDDEAYLRGMLRRLLQAFGYTVHLAGDGREAEQMVRSLAGELDAVLLDLSMPEVDGSEALRIIRDIEPRLPVLLMSGYGEADVERMLGERVGGMFLQKPFDPHDLLKRLDALLRTRIS